jgi:hypothetical protein
MASGLELSEMGTAAGSGIKLGWAGREWESGLEARLAEEKTGVMGEKEGRGGVTDAGLSGSGPEAEVEAEVEVLALGQRGLSVETVSAGILIKIRQGN